MTNRASTLFCAAILAFAAIGAARSAAVASVSVWDPDMTAPSVDDVAAAAARARAAHCRTSSCKAIVAIHELADNLQYEFGDENGENEYIGNRPAVAGRRLDRVLLDHPELYGPVCATGAKLISRVDPDTGEIFIPVLLLLHAVDMDLRDRGHCTHDLVAALPKDIRNDQIRINARTLCVNGDENHHRPNIACAVLVEGVDEKQ